jgi:hypothetical protein
VPADEFATTGLGTQARVSVSSTAFTTLRVADVILQGGALSANRVAVITLVADGETYTVEARITDEAYLGAR